MAKRKSSRRKTSNKSFLASPLRRIFNSKAKIAALFAFVLVGGGFMLYSSFAGTPGAVTNCAYEDRTCMYNSSQGHIMRLYKGTFNNYGDKGGVDYWTGVYKNAGYNLGEAGQHIVAANGTIANMNKTDFVKTMYSRYLGRTPSQSDIDYWSGTMADTGGKAKVGVMYNISQGTEATNRIKQGLTDKAVSFYGIQPTPTSGGTSSGGTSSGGTSSSGSTTITTSDITAPNRMADCGNDAACIYNTREGHTARFYWAMTKTTGDKAGIGYWLSKYSGTSNQVGAWMLETDQGKTLRTMSANDFVTRLYVNFLGVNPDTAGRDYWAKRIGSGSTNDRAKLILHFSESAGPKDKTKGPIATKLISYFGNSDKSPEEQTGHQTVPAVPTTTTGTAGNPTTTTTTVARTKPSLPSGCSSNIQSRPTVRKGQSHACISYLQLLLNYRIGTSLPGTSYFGTQTDTAVRAYQKKFGLQTDGVVGVQTWTHLETNKTVAPGVTVASSGSTGGTTTTRTTRSTTLISTDPAGYDYGPVYDPSAPYSLIPNIYDTRSTRDVVVEALQESGALFNGPHCDYACLLRNSTR